MRLRLIGGPKDGDTVELPDQDGPAEVVVRSYRGPEDEWMVAVYEQVAPGAFVFAWQVTEAEFRDGS